MALQISVGNLGGVVGTNIYLEREAPRYPLGYGFSLSILVVASISATILRVLLKRENEKRSRMSDEEVRAKYTRKELYEMGDLSPLFRYTL